MENITSPIPDDIAATSVSCLITCFVAPAGYNSYDSQACREMTCDTCTASTLVGL